MKRTFLVMLCLVLLTALPSIADTFGRGVSLGERVPISRITSDPASYLGKTVAVEGTVVRVCRTRGCWMELAGDKEYETFRVKVDDGVIVFPMSSIGRVATVQGEIEAVHTRCNESEAEKKGDCVEKRGVYYQIRATGAVIE
ncbi:MAG: hypothetical protein C0609_07200 [Deltaproteobacteria bacterium]|nr:MAG: hypothetical protein C0609_07200 [Deltaproteobacteria bacterium]